MTSDPRLLTLEEVAAELRLPKATLYQWRYERRGPKGFRVGKHVRYRRSDLDLWIEEQEQAELAGRA